MIRTRLAMTVALAGCASAPGPSTTLPAYAGPIIDMHAHLRLGERDGASTEHPIGTVELRALEQRAGAIHVGLVVIAPKGDLAETRARNDGAIAAASASNGFFFPVASVHPDDGKVHSKS